MKRYKKQNGSILVIVLIVAMSIGILTGSMLYLWQVNTIYNHSFRQLKQATATLQSSLENYVYHPNWGKYVSYLVAPQYNNVINNITISGGVQYQISQPTGYELFSSLGNITEGVRLSSYGNNGRHLNDLTAVIKLPSLIKISSNTKRYVQIPYSYQSNLRPGAGNFEYKNNSSIYYNSEDDTSSSTINLPGNINDMVIKLAWKKVNNNIYTQVIIFNINTLYISNWLPVSVATETSQAATDISSISFTDYSATLLTRTGDTFGNIDTIGNGDLFITITGDADTYFAIYNYDTQAYKETVASQQIQKRNLGDGFLVKHAVSDIDQDGNSEHIIIAGQKKNTADTTVLFNIDYTNSVINSDLLTTESNCAMIEVSMLNILEDNGINLLLSCTDGIYSYVYNPNDAIQISLEYSILNIDNTDLVYSYNIDGSILLISFTGRVYYLEDTNNIIEKLPATPSNTMKDLQFIFNGHNYYAQLNGGDCLNDSATSKCRLLEGIASNTGITSVRIT